MYIKWLLVAILFFIIEVITPGIFLFSCFSIGAITAMIVSLFSQSLLLQCLTFAIFSIISIYFLKPFLMKLLTPLTIKSNIDSVIGQSGVVIEDINGKKTMGIVKVNNELWRAISENDEIIEKNTEIIVINVEGVHLIVKKK